MRIAQQLWTWVEATRVATTIGESPTLTGFLSAVHLVGLTLLVGAALVSGLRLLGLLLPDRPVPDVAGAAGRGIPLGLAISLVSGLLLFSPRASQLVGNGFFQLKMALLVVAAVFHAARYRHATRRVGAGRLALAATGALGVALWLGVVLAGCALILLE
jgi:hypothetical protein